MLDAAQEVSATGKTTPPPPKKKKKKKTGLVKCASTPECVCMLFLVQVREYKRIERRLVECQRKQLEVNIMCT